MYMHIQLPVHKALYRALKFFGLSVEWEVSVGACLFRERITGDKSTREYLILKYPSGHYDFAKGHVEAGETEEETLRRETEEETGIRELVAFPERTTIKYFYTAKGSELRKRKKSGRGWHIFKEVHFYPAQCPYKTRVVISDEHVGFVWMNYKKARKRVTFDNARAVLDLAETVGGRGV